MPVDMQKQYYRPADKVCRKTMVAGLLLACDWRVMAVESRILQRSRDVSPREMYRLHHKKLVLSRRSKERLAYTVRRRPIDGSMVRVARSYPLLAIILCF